jgi:hypothetical protein
VAKIRAPEKIVNTIAKDREREHFRARLSESLIAQNIDPTPTRLASEFNARFLGRSVGSHACRKWLVGESIPTQEKLVVLAAMLGVDPDWLRYGDTSQRKRAPHVASVSTVPYGRHELVLIADYKRLQQRDQALVRGLVGAMLKAGSV